MTDLKQEYAETKILLGEKLEVIVRVHQEPTTLLIIIIITNIYSTNILKRNRAQ